MMPAITIILATILLPLAVVAVIYLVVPAIKGTIWLVKHLFRFVAGMLGDVLRIAGAVITSLILVPLTIGSIVLGRWSATAHYGRAIQEEMVGAGRCLYRLAIGHWARLLGLTPLTEGIERRIPQVIAQAPGSDRPARRAGQFAGYKIIGSLPGGGSGAKLYVAEPEPEKLAAWARRGLGGVGRVVIKSFSLSEGSSLPQIVRESRSLEAARKQGLILDHELSAERFYYVMEYVPGDSLALVTQRLHARSGGEGLRGPELREALGYGRDLVRTLQGYHAGGLWHKDVKPDNIIVSDGRAHLVDFGLVTPLRSSMTLTTHGTEYFRDPEMVRQALRGVKVHQVDGARFDIYAAGAVLFSMIENSFPAHGGLSQLSKRCPEALRWIVRRAMTDYDKRYPSAHLMLADLEMVAQAEDPFALRPADLPSFRGGADAEPAPHADEAPIGAGFGGAAGVAAAGAAAAGAAAAASVGAEASAHPPFEAAGASARQRATPILRVVDWWTGKYRVDGQPVRAERRGSPRAGIPVGSARPAVYHGMAEPMAPIAPVAPVRPARAGARGSAAEQRERARKRVQAAQERARTRAGARRHRHQPAGLNAGAGIAVLIFLGGVGLVAASIFAPSLLRRGSPGVVVAPPEIDVTMHEHSAVVSPVPGVRIVTRGGTSVTVTPPPPAPSAPPAPPAPEAPVVAAVPGVAVAVPEIPAAAPEVPAAAPTGELDDLTIAVLRDATLMDRINAHVQAMIDDGAEVVDTRPPAGEPDWWDAEVSGEMLSGLRARLGLAPVGSPDARQAITAWLDQHERIDAVVWFAPGASQQDSLRVLVYPRLGLAPETTADIRAALESIAR